MAFKKPPLKSPPHLLADWIEMRTLANSSNHYRISALKRYWDINRETENSDPSGQQRQEENTDLDGVSGADSDAFYSAITDELADRSNLLKDSYPFEFNGEKFKLKDKLSEGEYIYLFCLLLTHWNANDVMDGTWLPEINNSVRDLFQACSTLAAAGYVDGSSISFGWPRPNGNPAFLEKLNEVYSMFGEGEVVDVFPVGTSPFTKDGEVDVISWKPRVDKSPGTIYMLGQVASGDNWMVKSLKGKVDYFHHAWFKKVPASSVNTMTSMFIPRLVEEMYGSTRNERLHHLTFEFGVVFDRMCIPHYAMLGIMRFDNLHPEEQKSIERRNDMPQIVNWVDIQKNSLQAAI